MNYKIQSNMQNFVHLKVQSSYSLLESAIKTNKIIDLALKFNMPAVGLTDRNNLFGALEFSMAAMKKGLQPIQGIILDLAYHKSEFTEVILLAKNDKGLANLLKLASYPYIKNDRKKRLHITINDLKECKEGIILISSYKKGLITKHLGSNLDFAKQFASQLKEIFADNFYFEINRDGWDKTCEVSYFDLAGKLEIPVVATNDVLFADSTLHNVHDILLCIAQGTKQYDHTRITSNREHYFKSPHQMFELFADAPSAIDNAWLIAQRCSSCFMPRPMHLPNFGQGTSEDEILKEQAYKGLERRLDLLDKLSAPREQYFKQLDYELSIICQMKFAGYFLIVSDFIGWSKSQGIAVGPGRGSGAGSIVAWSLQITDLDPLRFGLIFERFLNPERVSMPDFDIDFCQARRDEVIDYVTHKYGSQRVAHIITFGSMQAKGVIKDVARVIDVPYKYADYLTELVPFNAVNPVTLSQAINEVGELKRLYQGEGFYNPEALGLPQDPEEREEFNKLIQEVLNTALELEGVHRHVSTHAAGMVISGHDIIEAVPLYMDKASKLYIVQYSMKYAEAAGLIKFDFLGLQTLTLISNCLKLLKDKGIDIDIGNIALDHPKVYEMLSRGHTVGVFQFESVGMRDSIKRLKPDCIDDLMALSALYRPGPMDNIPTYIACKHGEQEPYYPHEMLKSVLKDTYGVIIYQEQVLEVAKVLAGYSLGKADLLRRAMGKKIRAEMEAQQEMFTQGCLANDISKEKATEIFALVEKFAGYGFNKAHAAAYGVISYQTAYLKALYAPYFFTAALNLDIDDHDKILIFVDEAKKNGIRIKPLDINVSSGYFVMDGEDTILFAFGAIKGVTPSFGDEVAGEREKGGKFAGIVEFIERMHLTNKKSLESLIKAGCFDSLHDNRKQLVDSIERLMSHSASYHQNKSTNQLNLFGGPVTTDILAKTAKDYNFLDKSVQEFSVLGSFMQFHPMKFYAQHIICSNLVNSKEIPFVKKGQSRIKIAAAVQKKDTRSSARGRFITLVLSDLYGLIEVSIFNEEVIKEYGEALQVAYSGVFECEIQKNEHSVRATLVSVEKMDDLMKSNFYNLKLRLKDDQLKECLSFLETKKSKNKHNAKIEVVINYNKNFLANLVLPQVFYLEAQDKMYLDQYAANNIFG